jgi:hypothetical protein
LLVLITGVRLVIGGTIRTPKIVSGWAKTIMPPMAAGILCVKTNTVRLFLLNNLSGQSNRVLRNMYCAYQEDNPIVVLKRMDIFRVFFGWKMLF